MFGGGNFGGGFGQPPQQQQQQQQQPGFGQPPQQQGFGQAQPQQQTQGFGTSSFGTSATHAAPPAFGANPAPAAPAFGAAPPFGAPAPAFGQPTTAAPAFGAPSSTPFGTVPAAPAPSTGGFGNPFGTLPSGQQAPTPAFGTAPSLASPQGGFGGAPAGPFGQPAASGFGQQQQSTQSNPFGQTPAPSAFPTPTTQNNAPPAFTAPNPFGQSNAAPAPAISFGVSSNLGGDSDMMSGSISPVPPQSSPFHTTSNNNNNSGGGLFSPGLPQPGNDNSNDKKKVMTPFGTPVSNNQSNNSNAQSTFPAPSTSMDSSNPFGAPMNASSTNNPSTNPFGSAVNAQSSNPFGGPSFSGDDNDASKPNDANNNEDHNERLARLKAKLEEKKKRLAEKKQKEAGGKLRKDEEAKSKNDAGAPNRRSKKKESGLNPDARSFSPTRGADDGSSKADASLAERNAVRFATGAASQVTRGMLPKELQNEAATDYSALRQTNTETRDLGSAKSLLGSCPYMCPDEELLRREREGDIQLLELVKPGELHPAGWTLRDTCVKRFRRSAADYKLDVPEWVRPPQVLERVCSYLEEWVMERDRQGSDPRFASGNAPPPLDVYQFIWDRTRMVRKDFILQNYVGTGGKCDARAVRCHERIARWHAMCEHQLSHINDFAVMQSQQNIQELGQTMKTLNQYYDDALKRSTIEEPDEDGNETFKHSDGSNSLAHGCQSQSVQGTSPVDYDGKPLQNTPDKMNAASRAIGKPNQHGTAEPEMSGLYILLTLDNDGGMEVLRFAAHLSRARPHIFQSTPVQLALSIYKTKKELNYAKFFKILRDPATPYLFACIMFKYVEVMRKQAIEIMSKTYGGLTKDSGEALYDQYFLKNLVKMLCFEDEDEAAATCKHYNITVKETKLKSTSGTKVAQVIFWRHSKFRERMDEEKGTKIPIRPRKMVSTIEEKLRGATRLAVCRGEVSGEGAFFTNPIPLQNKASNTMHSEEDRLRLEEMRRAEEAKRAAEDEQQAQQALARQRQREEEDRQQQAALEKERQRQEKLRQEEEAKERERQRIQKEREEAQQRAQEEERIRQEKIAEAKRIEDERKKAEEERKRKAEEERQRQEELVRLKKEQERLEAERRRAEAERQRRMEEERQRKLREAEARRLELERQRKEREHREAEERRLEAEWSSRSSSARKKLSFLRLMKRFPTYLRLMDENNHALQNLGRNIGAIHIPDALRRESLHARPTLRGLTESLLRRDAPTGINISDVFGRLISNKQDFPSTGSPILIQLNIVLPTSANRLSSSLNSLITTWIGKAMHFDTVQACTNLQHEVRIVCVKGSTKEEVSRGDGVILVTPVATGEAIDESVDSLESILDQNIPRVHMLLMEDTDEDVELISSVFEKRCSGSSGELYTITNPELSEDALCDCLTTSIDYVAHEILKFPLKQLERYDVDELCTRTISSAMWSVPIFDKRDDLLENAKEALYLLVEELPAIFPSDDKKWIWPTNYFADKQKMAVPDYYGKGEDLPLDWLEASDFEKIGGKLQRWMSRMNGAFEDVLQSLLIGAPEDILMESRALIENGEYKRCLHVALLWKSHEAEPWESEVFLYLPRGYFDDLVGRVVGKLSSRQDHSALLTTGSMENNTFQPTDNNLLALRSPPPPQGDNSPFSPKRPRDTPESTTDDSIPQLESAQLQRIPPKKQRISSKTVQDSTAFTRRLEAMLAGELVEDRMIGRQPLSALLRGAPKPKIPNVSDVEEIL